MSEHMPADIQIGGKVLTSLVPALCAAIAKQRVSLDWGDAEFCPVSAEDLQAACDTNDAGELVLRLYDEQAPWGEFEALEGFLQRHGIAYTRRTSGRYEYDPELAEFRPERGLAVLPTNGAGEPVIAASALAAVEETLAGALEAADAGPGEATRASIQHALATLHQALPTKLAPLEPFQIVGDETCEVKHG